VDREEEAKQLVDLFRVDLIWAIGNTDGVKSFSEQFPYLITPFFHDRLLLGDPKQHSDVQVLDVQNAIVHLLDGPEWSAVTDRGVRIYTWQPEDPLADIFLVQFGSYPSVEASGRDYRAMLVNAAEATDQSLASSAVIPEDVLRYPSIPYVSRMRLRRHYAMGGGRDSPGYFVGEAGNVDDLVCHWNLRAANIPLLFVDTSQFSRYAEIIPAWYKQMQARVARRHEWDRYIGVWSRREDIDEVSKKLGDMQLMRCPVSGTSWNGQNVRVPMMHLGQASVLGVVGHEGGRPRVSFALSEKPFCGDVRFHQQHLVASVSLRGGLYADELHSFEPPYLPEFNEFYARTMHLRYNKLRIEPGRLGLVIGAAEHDSFLYALPVTDLMERMFEMTGYEAKLSPSGLIARQLLARLGGLQGARVFKIPGVRRLLRTYGPMAAFTKRSALQLIGGRDPQNPEAGFSDHEGLYIEPRRKGGKLTPHEVFGYLIEKGLFRIGVELTCPSCRMVTWNALDSLQQRVVCELCGNEHDATRQLVNAEWHFRRSGILGAERNALGAIPVALTLQQLGSNLDTAFISNMYSVSLSLEPKEGIELPACEIDFVWLMVPPYPQRAVVILGECKDRGNVKLEEFKKDVEHLGRVADAFPARRFDAFVLLSKLAPFSPEEVQAAESLNGKYLCRTILLTARELEPYYIYERTNAELKINGHGGTPEELAQTTAQVYFEPPVTS
jgi:hypothetical protein